MLRTGTTVVTVTFKNIKTAKSTAKKYRCVVKAAIEPEKPVEPEVVKATKITEAKVSTAKTVTVKFDGVVDTTTTQAIKLARGTTDITVTPAFNSDKTELVLTASTALAAGTYTVTVGSFAPVSFNVAKQVPTTLKINNTTVANQNGARIYFQVLDQYGDVMPNYTAKKLSVTAYNTTKGHSVNPANLNSSDDYFTVDTGTEDTSAAGMINAIDDTISIVAYLKDTPAVSCTASLKIVRVYTESLEFGDIVLDTHKRVTTGNRYELKYTAKDNEGNDVVFENDQIHAGATTATVTIGDYTFVSGNPSAVPMNQIQIDSKKKLTFMALNRGTAVITAVNNNTGANSTITIEVNDEPALAALDIADASVANNAPNNYEFKAAVVAYDQFGEIIDAQNLKGQTLAGLFTISNSLGVSISPDRFSSDGKYIIYKKTTAATLSEGNAKFTFISITVGPNGTLTSTSDVEISDASEPSALEVVKEPSKTAISGDDIKIQLAVKDQYQDKLSVASLGGINGSNNYEIELEGSDIFNTTAATVTPSAVAGQTNVYEIPVKATYAGTAADAVSKTGTLTISLKEGAKVIDSKTFTVNVGKAITDYEVTTNSDVYNAGDKITVTVKALSGTQFNSLLNGDVKVSVAKTESTTKNTYETLKFKDGVATLELKAQEACTKNGLITITNTKDGVDGDNSTAKYTVLVGSAGKFALDGSGQLVFKDSEGNALSAGTGIDTSSYASYKLMNKTTGKEITVTAVSDGAVEYTTTSNQTMSVVIDNTTHTVTSMGAIGDYNLSATGGIYVKGVSTTNATKGDLLEFSITINGVTWTSSTRFNTDDSFTDGDYYKFTN